MHWSASYVGLPWQERGLTREGIACWGLARLVYAEQLGIEVPDYAAEVPSLTERVEVAAIFANRTSASGPWVSVGDAREFDILVFRRAGLTTHVGIALDGERMLHIDAGGDSHLASYTTGRWASRLAGAYRHRSVMEAARAA